MRVSVYFHCGAALLFFCYGIQSAESQKVTKPSQGYGKLNNYLIWFTCTYLTQNDLLLPQWTLLVYYTPNIHVPYVVIGAEYTDNYFWAIMLSEAVTFDEKRFCHWRWCPLSRLFDIGTISLCNEWWPWLTSLALQIPAKQTLQTSQVCFRLNQTPVFLRIMLPKYLDGITYFLSNKTAVSHLEARYITIYVHHYVTMVIHLMIILKETIQ